MLFAELVPGTPGKYLVGLPGNPLAAVSGLLTLAEPLLRTLSGQGLGAPGAHGGGAAAVVALLTDAVQGHPHDTRLVPAAVRGERGAQPLHFNGPAMLRGVAAADGLAVISSGGADAGTTVEILPLPWKAGQGVGPAGTGGTTGGLALDSTPRPSEAAQPGRRNP
jgi:molybdopterin molybdotransferase